MKKIHLLVPNFEPDFGMQDFANQYSCNDFAVSWSGISEGPRSIESAVDEALSLPPLIKDAIALEAKGVDAIIIDCMGDPGLCALREAVQIPVFGPGNVSMHIAGTIGRKFSVITVLERLHPFIEEHAKQYGVESLLASVRSIDVPVLSIETGTARVFSAFLDQAIEAITKDKCDAIILGCTGFNSLYAELKTDLSKLGHGGVQIIEPLSATLRYAQAMLQLDLSHSKVAYPTPLEK